MRFKAKIISGYSEYTAVVLEPGAAQGEGLIRLAILHVISGDYYKPGMVVREPTRCLIMQGSGKKVAGYDPEALVESL